MAKNDTETQTQSVSPETLAIIQALQANTQAMISALLKESNTQNKQAQTELFDMIRNPPKTAKEMASLAMEKQTNRESREKLIRDKIYAKRSCDHMQGMNGSVQNGRSTLQAFTYANRLTGYYCKKCGGEWFPSIMKDDNQDILKVRPPAGAWSKAGECTDLGDLMDAWERMLPQFHEKQLIKKHGQRVFDQIWGKDSEYATEQALIA